MRGIVAAFDETAGHGLVRAHDGSEWFFHAVAIADGSRTIEVGTAVDFQVVPGLAGRWEAASVRGVG